MDTREETRSAAKHRAILEAATAAFLANGYLGTNMDEIATRASVSKRTVYQHFADKERLFTEIVLATTDEIDALVRLVADSLAESEDVAGDLRELARRLLADLMQPQLLRLRRLVIASADRFPDLGSTWYERGFGRVLGTLAASFRELATRGLLRVDDPWLAANYFVGQLLWIPMNEAMFTGDDQARSPADLERYADAAVRAFMEGHAARPAAGRGRR
jgi:TetR/AcrR family transcriptional regulator, mexJK operon transcriptional repressor